MVNVKQLKELKKSLNPRELEKKLSAGAEVFEKFRTDLIQIQENQLEFEVWLKAINQNQKYIMEELNIKDKFVKFEDLV